MHDFIDERLAQLLLSKHNALLPIVKKDNEVTQETYIVHRFLYAPGTEWTGHNEFCEVELVNFSRQNGKKLRFTLKYSIHDMSNQLDDWELKADGIEEDELSDFKNLCNPYNYQNCFGFGAYLKPSCEINGKLIEF